MGERIGVNAVTKVIYALVSLVNKIKIELAERQHHLRYGANVVCSGLP